MYKSVYELTQDQLNELKEMLWDLEDMDEVWGDDITDWEDIPNEFVLDYYADFNFTDDDFFCSSDN